MTRNQILRLGSALALAVTVAAAGGCAKPKTRYGDAGAVETVTNQFGSTDLQLLAEQMTQSMPVITEEPLVLLDWLPWNHTFGGNHNFGMVVFHGGTLYVDDGKPTKVTFRR